MPGEEEEEDEDEDEEEEEEEDDEDDDDDDTEEGTKGDDVRSTSPPDAAPAGTGGNRS